MKILITGGCGFIGSNFIKFILNKKKYKILNLDKLSEISMPESLNKIKNLNNYYFKKIDLCNAKLLNNTVLSFKPDIVINFAAESHVDRSITNPDVFIKNNINGLINLLISCKKLIETKKHKLKFIQISTDEVYGSLSKNEKSFNEKSPYKPNSPYSASKASCDLLIRSWIKTYNFPAIITHSSNNFGPWQHPEKFIPVVISSILQNKKIPVYGNGKNIRDWIFVGDYVKILFQIISKGKIGEIYNIGSNNEFSNLEIIRIIINFFNKKENKLKFNNVTKYVKDRPGHDFRYSIDNSKLKKEFKIKFKKNFVEKINYTIKWYLDNKKWLLNKDK